MTMPYLERRLFNTPHLITPEKLDEIVHAVGGRLDVASHAMERAPTKKAEIIKHRVGFHSLPDTVAVINVHGTLVNRGAWIGAMSGLTSYEGLARQLDEARRPVYGSVILDMHSYGGEAIGCFDLARRVAALREEKPIYAIVNSAACSAAYAIAAACTKIYAVPGAMVGSIGVIAAHLDRSRRHEQEGDSWTLVYQGERKVDFASTAPLGDEARADLEREIGRLYDDFVAHVSEVRPALTAAAVREQRSAAFVAEDARPAGLIDEIMPAHQAISSILEEVSMSISQPGPEATSPNTATPEAETPNDAVMAEAEKLAQGMAEKIAAERIASAISADRDRCAAIVADCERLDQKGLAGELIQSGASVEQGKAALFDRQAATHDATSVNATHDGGTTDPVQAEVDRILSVK